MIQIISLYYLVTRSVDVYKRQDLEREQEEIEIRVNAVREGRMRVAGAIERSQTVKEQLNVRIIGLDHQIEEIKRQINDQEKEKDSSSQKIEEINEKKKRSEIERCV